METTRPSRVFLLDEVRGVCILLMVLYHILYDLVYLFPVQALSIVWKGCLPLEPWLAGSFILISGVACRYSRSNIRRGAIALGLGLGITAVTLLLLPEQQILYGILHFLGTAMLLFGLVHKALDKLPPAVGLVLCAAAYWLTRGVSRGWLGLSEQWGAALPSWSSPLLLPLGFGGRGADYFPIFPWIFVFFAGAYLGCWFVRGQMPAACYRLHARWLAGVGRHTLWIYVLHQPVIYGALWLLFALLPAA